IIVAQGIIIVAQGMFYPLEEQDNGPIIVAQGISNIILILMIIIVAQGIIIVPQGIFHYAGYSIIVAQGIIIVAQGIIIVAQGIIISRDLIALDDIHNSSLGDFLICDCNALHALILM
ncbi:hypothetical protein ACJX0J_022538, partial [Zea mays]